MRFSFNLLRIESLYLFPALLVHSQDAMHKRHWVYCAPITSVRRATIAVTSSIKAPVTYTCRNVSLNSNSRSSANYKRSQITKKKYIKRFRFFCFIILQTFTTRGTCFLDTAGVFHVSPPIPFTHFMPSDKVSSELQTTFMPKTCTCPHVNIILKVILN
jgi:hypothetical protein